MRPRRVVGSRHGRSAAGVAAVGAVGITLAAGVLAAGSLLVPVAADSAWSTAVRLSADTLNSDQPAVAESADGSTSAAVWLETGATVDTVRASTRGTGGWSAAADLEGGGVDTAHPSIALSADGTRSIAGWQAWLGGYGIARAAVRTAGTWSAPMSLSLTGHSAQAPLVGMTGDGAKAVALWVRFDGSNDIVQASTWDGSTWSGPVPLSTSGQSATWPRLAVAAATGTAIAVWQRWNGSAYVVQWSRWNGSTWSTGTDLSPAGVNVAQPQPAITADGTHATVVWERFDANPNRNYVVQATSWNGSVWTAPQSLSSASTADTDPQLGLGIDGDRTVVAWHRNAAGNDMVEAAARTGGTWSSAVTVSSAAESAVPPYPQIGVSSDGTAAIATWCGLVAQHYQVVSATWNGTWSNPATLSDVDASLNVLGTSGNATRGVAGWLRYDGSHAVVQAAVLAPAPPPASSPPATSTAPTTATTPPTTTPTTTPVTPTRAVTKIVGWPTKPITARAGRGAVKAVALKVTVTPARARKGTVQVWGRCRVVGKRTICRWVTYRVVTWPNRSTGSAVVVLTAARGRRATYRLVIPLTATATAATTRAVLVVGS